MADIITINREAERTRSQIAAEDAAHEFVRNAVEQYPGTQREAWKASEALGEAGKIIREAVEKLAALEPQLGVGPTQIGRRQQSYSYLISCFADSLSQQWRLTADAERVLFKEANR